MANTIHGPYVPTVYSTTMTKGNATNLETGPGVALASFNPDLIGAAFIQSGVACVKDATTTTQLNVTSGKAYLLMTDGTNARIDVVSTTFSTTGHPSTTLFLDLNPDGSWSFATTHSAQANFLPICVVTTDGSSNISGVVDARLMYAAVLAAMANPSVGQPGGLALPSPLAIYTSQSVANAGTVSGGVTFAQKGALRGSMDRAALFNGSTGAISCPTSGLPTGANAPVSLECWYMQASTPGTTQTPMTIGNPGVNGAEFYIAFATATAPWAGNGTTNSNSAPATALNVWHHVVGTFDGSNIRVYVDGALVSGPTAASITLAYGVLSIGQQGNSADWFAGSLDEVAVYGAALSSTRILAHYNAGLSTTADAYAAVVLADAPLRYYRLGDGSGSSVARASTSATLMQILDAAGNLYVPGALTTVAGQATAGSFGVPVIVAQALRSHVTTVGSNVTILSFTPNATGLYRVNGYVLMQDSAARALGFFVTWTDPDLNSGLSEWLAAPGGVSGFTIQAFNNSNTWNNNVAFGAYSTPFMAKAGTPIIVSYQHDTGTANDFVTALIEQLA